jgi:GT2 family glycosyltransferase
MRRWPQLAGAVASVLAQSPRPARLVVAVDHNDELLDRARRELAGVAVVPNVLASGASGNRNTGIAHTDTPLVALLDDDARARPGWLAGLLAPFEDSEVIGTGGAIVPDWEQPRPAWFPDELLWTIAATPRTGTAPSTVRNVWSASMSVRRDAFDAAGGFRVGFGTRDHRTGLEDTDLCLRMSRATPGRWVYVPDALVDHAVPAERGTLRYLVARCCREGYRKIEMTRSAGGVRALDVERAYLRRSLSRAVLGGFGATLQGRGAVHAARATVVLAGFSAALAGAAVGAASTWLRRPHLMDELVASVGAGHSPPALAAHDTSGHGDPGAGGRER